MSLPIYHMISSGPRPVAPFSHAVEADGWVFITGQMPTDAAAPDRQVPSSAPLTDAGRDAPPAAARNIEPAEPPVTSLPLPAARAQAAKAASIQGM